MFFTNRDLKEQVLFEDEQHDNSYRSKLTSIFKRYNSSDARDIWRSGISRGFDIGYNAAVEELNKNTNTPLFNNDNSPNTKERLDNFNREFLELSNKYGMGLTYIHSKGLCVEDLTKRRININNNNNR